jgi:hypothetical protein
MWRLCCGKNQSRGAAGGSAFSAKHRASLGVPPILAHKREHGIARFDDSLLRSPREIGEREHRWLPVKS